MSNTDPPRSDLRAALDDVEGPHAHTEHECGVMVHVGSRHYMDEPCTRSDGYRCRFEPRRFPAYAASAPDEGPLLGFVNSDPNRPLDQEPRPAAPALDDAE